jgi:hypothetical protein
MFIISDIKGTSIAEYALISVSVLNGHSSIEDTLLGVSKRKEYAQLL